MNLTPTLSDLKISAAVPTFGDINSDGHLDLLIGTQCGRILHYRNESPFGVFPPNFVLKDNNILQTHNIRNIGAFLAPQLFDLNGDGLLDIVVGNQRIIWRDAQDRPYFKSSITYLKNVGTREKPEFTLITDSLGRVDVINRERSNNGYNKPHFFRDSQGNIHLFCGNEDGKVLHYTDIEDNLFDGGTFQRLDDIRFRLNDNIKTLCEGSFTAVAVADFNGDGFLDMVVGNHRGGLTIFLGISQLPVRNIERTVDSHGCAALRIYPNPVKDFLFIQTEKTERMQGQILDLQGRIVRFLGTVRNDQSIDVRELPAGIYLLKITTGDQVFAQKFIKI